MLSKKRMIELVFDAFVAGLFAVFGPIFLKLAGFSKESSPYKWFDERNVLWMLYPWDALMVGAMLVTNTISVKYRMLSFKFNGAFIGTTLIFVFTSILSAPADLIFEDKFLRWQQIVGLGLMILGVCVVAYEHEENKVNDPSLKRLNSGGADNDAQKHEEDHGNLRDGDQESGNYAKEGEVPVVQRSPRMPPKVNVSTPKPEGNRAW